MTYLDPPLTHLKKSESDKKIRSKNSIGKNFRFSENRSQKSLIVTTFSEKPDFPKNGSENRKIEKSLIVKAGNRLWALSNCENASVSLIQGRNRCFKAKINS